MRIRLRNALNHSAPEFLHTSNPEHGNKKFQGKTSIEYSDRLRSKSLRCRSATLASDKLSGRKKRGGRKIEGVRSAVSRSFACINMYALRSVVVGRMAKTVQRVSFANRVTVIIINFADYGARTRLSKRVLQYKVKERILDQLRTRRFA